MFYNIFVYTRWQNQQKTLRTSKENRKMTIFFLEKNDKLHSDTDSILSLPQFSDNNNQSEFGNSFICWSILRHVPVSELGQALKIVCQAWMSPTYWWQSRGHVSWEQWANRVSVPLSSGLGVEFCINAESCAKRFYGLTFIPKDHTLARLLVQTSKFAIPSWKVTCLGKSRPKSAYKNYDKLTIIAYYSEVWFGT